MKPRKFHSKSNIGPLIPSRSSGQVGLERLVFFSDAVFAIAITLLALEIRLPSNEILNDTQLLSQLTGIWHKYLAYVISFLVIGIFWMAHHRRYSFIKRCDDRLMLINLFMLMVIAFIPFPTSILSIIPGRTATIFYALTMLITGLLLATIWWYASWKNRLIAPDMDANLRYFQFFGPLAISTIFLISIGVAFIQEDIAKFCWLLILPVGLITNKTG
jgi:uncharacterized membrane protein